MTRQLSNEDLNVSLVEVYRLAATHGISVYLEFHEGEGLWFAKMYGGPDVEVKKMTSPQDAIDAVCKRFKDELERLKSG